MHAESKTGDKKRRSCLLDIKQVVYLNEEQIPAKHFEQRFLVLLDLKRLEKNVLYRLTS